MNEMRNSKFVILSDSSGFIALISVVIIVLILLGTTIALATSGFLNRFNILDGEAKEISAGYALSCVEAARIKYVRDGAPIENTTSTIGDGTCTLSEVSHDSNTVTIRARGEHENTHAVTKYEAVINDTGAIESLKEI